MKSREPRRRKLTRNGPRCGNRFHFCRKLLITRVSDARTQRARPPPNPRQLIYYHYLSDCAANVGAINFRARIPDAEEGSGIVGARYLSRTTNYDPRPRLKGHNPPCAFCKRRNVSRRNRLQSPSFSGCRRCRRCRRSV